LVAATDNSVYQILPQAVVFPRDVHDVVRALALLEEPAFHSVTLTARGGGTGTNGQSLSHGVILDLSRHMHSILELNLVEGWVRVQPGVVLDQLNDALRPHGVHFAATLSPSNRATLGGMIATDASGKGSRLHGKTSDHILGLETALVGGAVHSMGPLSSSEVSEVGLRDDRVGCVHREVASVVAAHAEAIRAAFPPLKRFLTGYNLAMVCDADGGMDLSRLVAGSEGTLGVVTEARLRLTPIAPERALVLLRYASFDDALEDAEVIAQTEPSAIETVGERILTLARSNPIWERVGDLVEAPDGSAVAAINLVEFEGTDPGAVQRIAESLESAEVPGRKSARLAVDAEEMAALWSLRKEGVGLLGATPGRRKPVPFIEDTVVPPARLRAYVAELRALLDAEGLSYGMFGHIDVGCLHVRPALDLRDPEDEARLQRISDQVVALVGKYGGVLWGEHGKGFRSVYGPKVFGPEVFGAFRRVKEAFDPRNQLNPGKIATPLSSEAELAGIDSTTRGSLDRQIGSAAQEDFAAVLACNGNGVCMDYDPNHVMCPSSRITRDGIHSPKGRAGVFREWLRQVEQRRAPRSENGSSIGGDSGRMGRAHPPWWGGPFRFLGRLVRTVGLKLGMYDYSEEVHAAMDGCLACKACTTQCPVKVDVPSFRARFLSLYHERYLRPLSDVLIGALEGMIGGLSRWPRISNLLMGNFLSRWFLRHVVGLVDTPSLSVPSFAEGLASEGRVEVDIAQLEGLSPERRENTVVLIQDAFTRAYEAPVALAMVDLLEGLGWEVAVLRHFPSGKGLHVKGYQRRFHAVARRNVALLRRVAATGIPMVGLDPAIVLAFREEHVEAIGEAAGFRVALPQEFLVEHLDRVRSHAGEEIGGPHRLLGHCTERTASAGSQRAWVSVFEAMGLRLETVAVGCCGMCGAWGHEARHASESKGIYRMSWEGIVEGSEAEPEKLLATGHSCRSQIKRMAERSVKHPAEALVACLGSSVSAGA
jgi:FAD/FMN-containing dehydrogenase/Fe-S oxidoreductase